MKAYQGVVTGKVQGVFFRASTQEKAKNLNVTGWVKNNRDGAVEFFIQGEEESLNNLSNWLRIGPPLAEVRDLSFQEVNVDSSINTFEIKKS